MQTAQGIIDRLSFDSMKARDVAQFFEPCRNFNSCISDSACDPGIFQLHHRHSVKIYPRLFIRIRHTFTVPTSVVWCKLSHALHSIKDTVAAKRLPWSAEPSKLCELSNAAAGTRLRGRAGTLTTGRLAALLPSGDRLSAHDNPWVLVYQSRTLGSGELGRLKPNRVLEHGQAKRRRGGQTPHSGQKCTD
jgi:hypothetical protein